MVKVNGVNGLEKARIWVNATAWNAKAHVLNALTKAGLRSADKPMPGIISEVTSV